MGDRTFFTHNLNTVYHIMKLFVDEFIRKAKLFCIYCINEDVWIKNLPFIWLLFSGSTNRRHCNTSLFWEGKKYTKCWLLFQGLPVAKQVVYFFTKLRPGALASTLFTYKKNVYKMEVIVEFIIFLFTEINNALNLQKVRRTYQGDINYF